MRHPFFACAVAALVLSSCDSQVYNDETPEPPSIAETDNVLQKAPTGAEHGRRCGTYLDDPNIRQALQRAAESHVSKSTGPPINVPVVYHVIAGGPEVVDGNVPDSWIAAQHDVLEAAFAGSGFSIGSSTVLRTIDRRLNRCSSRGAESTLLSQRVGGPETLNIYVCDTGQYLGWAYLPGSSADGVFVWSFSLPNDQFGEPYNEGDTATHEVGHWLGLYHTFQAPDARGRPLDGCSEPGDFVSDTPPEASPAFGCPIGRDTCTGGGLDPIFNFMDYTDDACMVEFTSGQDDRMIAAWNEFRAPNI